MRYSPFSFAVETKILEQEDYFGYGPNSACENGTYDDMFRIKYGMYKDYQPGATFRADYRNVRIGVREGDDGDQRAKDVGKDMA